MQTAIFELLETLQYFLASAFGDLIVFKTLLVKCHHLGVGELLKHASVFVQSKTFQPQRHICNHKHFDTHFLRVDRDLIMMTVRSALVVYDIALDDDDPNC